MQTPFLWQELPACHFFCLLQETMCSVSSEEQTQAVVYHVECPRTLCSFSQAGGVTVDESTICFKLKYLNTNLVDYKELLYKHL